MDEDFSDKFDEYSIEFAKKLEYNCRGDWNLLDGDEQEIAALWKLIVDMYNGGFEQFFCNWGYDCYLFAMRGLKRISDNSLLEILYNTYMKVFDRFKNDERITKYWDIPQFFTPEDEQILSETDSAFWETEGEKMAKAALEFYRDKLNKQPIITKE
ncbi:MAG: DUF4375 domain-containing protein [Oscillospiraceae bacterium]